MGRLVDPPARFLGSEGLQHAPPCLPLQRRGERPAQWLVVHRVSPSPLDDRNQLLFQAVENPDDLGGGHSLLVVLEQDVVGSLDLREALDVALFELELPLEMRRERRKVGSGFGLIPRCDGDAVCPRHLAGELRGHAPRALPEPARDANQGGLVRVGIGVQSLQVPDEALVREASQRGRCLGTGLRSGRRHGDPSVPVEYRLGVLEVGDLAEDALQALERRGCAGDDAQAGWGASFSRR